MTAIIWYVCSHSSSFRLMVFWKSVLWEQQNSFWNQIELINYYISLEEYCQIRQALVLLCFRFAFVRSVFYGLLKMNIKDAARGLWFGLCYRNFLNMWSIYRQTCFLLEHWNLLKKHTLWHTGFWKWKAGDGWKQEWRGKYRVLL